ncbi:MAG: DUF4365 domain-containing protein [Chloroflexota bacterium]|nr:DUF4365 domain-containing protein [Chloroflexota bacterium]
MRIRSRKKLPREVIVGQQGVHLIEGVVLAMKCRWAPTGAVDAGIDGVIELADRADPPHPLGLVLHVQSRATEGDWANEDSSGFTYLLREEELSYWLQGNAPVLLIVSRPRTHEAYWVSIKDYFRDPASRRARRIIFNKADDAFTPAAYEGLFALARNYGGRDRGLYLGPLQKTEVLSTNLVPITLFGPRLYVAQTDHRTRGQVFDAIRASAADASNIGVFLTAGKSIVSPYDLREPPWPSVCDRGSVEEFDAAEWATSTDPDRRREYAALLRLALRELLYPHVRLWANQDLYAFHGFGELRERHFRFVVAGRRRNPSVVRVYRWTYEDQEYVRLRHLAMVAAFRRSGERWFIEITPSYLYTRDGRTVDGRQADLLSGIKRLERQPAVRAHVQLWAAYLARPGELNHPTYPYLAVGPLVPASASFGIPEDVWKRWDEEEEAADTSVAPEALPEPLWT